MHALSNFDPTSTLHALIRACTLIYFASVTPVHTLLISMLSIHNSYTFSFRSLAPLSTQKISYVSFENIDNLEVYLTNLDTGDKTLVTEDIDFLSLGGRMYEDGATLRFFIRQSSSVLFNDFYASTRISLINVQDVNSLKVTDSGFENVALAEFVRVSSCQNEDGVASCSKFDLFPESTGLGKYKQPEFHYCISCA